MAKRKRHTEQFKREAVAALESRGTRSIEDVAKGLGVAPGMVYQWRRKYGVDARKEGESLEGENVRLVRENVQLRRDRETLKKSIAFFVRDRS